MKQLTIIRHAKSSWDDLNLDDFDRPLNKRGFIDAPAMGKQLFKNSLIPDSIFSSPALRAITTAQIIARELRFEENRIMSESSIYEASAGQLWSVIEKLPNEYAHVFLVGHNPGMQHLTQFLTGRTIFKFPTCAVISLRWNKQKWSHLANTEGEIVFYDSPKNNIIMK